MISQTESPRSKARRRFLFPLLLIDAFFIGGMLTLFLVSRLLITQVEVYTPEYMAAASAILDFIDDLYPYHLSYLSITLLLVLVTLLTGLWTFARTPLYKYGIAALAAFFIIAGLILGLGRRTMPVEPIPFTTPTPPR